MMQNNPCQVNIISECFIKPKHRFDDSKQIHYLAPDDLIMLSLHYIHKGLLFNKPPGFDSVAFAHKLKRSLSIALLHFHPLAGCLATKKYADEHCSWIYVDSNKGPGARFILAQTDSLTMSLSNILSSFSDVVPLTRTLFDLGERGIVNYDGHYRALLSVQVTQLVDGVFVGFTMNHSVADATTLWHFIETLSEIYDLDATNSCPAMISRVPMYRTSFPEGISPNIKLPYVHPDEFISRFDLGVQLRKRIFQFSAETIASLETKVIAECSNDSISISPFNCLAALVWKSITKARNEPYDMLTTCYLVVNSRPHYNPPLCQEYFGNYSMMARGQCKTGQLHENSLGWAAMVLEQAVKAQDDQAARAAFKSYVKSPFVAQPGWSSSTFGSNGPIIIGGLPSRFDMNEPRFGLGRTIAVRDGQTNKDDGKVMANPGRDGGRSVELEICLTADTMISLLLDQDFMSYVS
ncbi:uncharacterized acetyltransferase At3g50280-like [Amaranthus tricolor]|uniref:uncharacterized acetyltransferase At3g50280-like n=1 Tax=Amaranthus tricolor TaxID=29722 RepID=UPI0025856FB4|nr:uncharacterized acetyltransferase At3g50280-like [Amaranthus tricolor]